MVAALSTLVRCLTIQALHYWINVVSLAWKKYTTGWRGTFNIIFRKSDCLISIPDENTFPVRNTSYNAPLTIKFQVSHPCVYFVKFHEILWGRCKYVPQWFSLWVMSDSATSWTAALQAPPSPGVCSDSCPLSWWCYITISSSAVPFSFWLWSFPASESFPISCLFTSGGQSLFFVTHPKYTVLFLTFYLKEV